ncbi:calmodulin-beta-like [Ananas comosus]|uniref:Calmodulin-beta-like n=1 Tax=Ananas comosus TaxID=4615 RepID=A0A199V366_ANACO|nr:calmodulin-beta-like [Ananas comosus]OAY71310.1 Calmodulin-like protein 1 [Ananas comosus]
MSQLRILSFKYHLSKLPLKPVKGLSFKDRQFSDMLLTFEPDVDDMKKVFGKMAGPNGKISTKDLKRLLQKLGKAPDEACQLAGDMVWAADTNKDGFIDFSEFMEVHKKGVRMSDIKQAFLMYDRDRDGRISAEELRDMLLKLGESYCLAQCEMMVKRVDRDGDGLDMQDFMAMMTRPRKKP